MSLEEEGVLRRRQMRGADRAKKPREDTCLHWGWRVGVGAGGWGGVGASLYCVGSLFGRDNEAMFLQGCV